MTIPVPGQQLVRTLNGMIRDATEDVGEPGATESWDNRFDSQITRYGVFNQTSLKIGGLRQRAPKFHR
jgi:hypothetical protein